jgi:hypothetical protein
MPFTKIVLIYIFIILGDSGTANGVSCHLWLIKDIQMKIQSKWTIMGDEETIMKIFKKIIFLVADVKEV